MKEVKRPLPNPILFFFFTLFGFAFSVSLLVHTHITHHTSHYTSTLNYNQHIGVPIPYPNIPSHPIHYSYLPTLSFSSPFHLMYPFREPSSYLCCSHPYL